MADLSQMTDDQLLALYQQEKSKGPKDVSQAWGPGASQLPNGQIVRYGPRGGMNVLGLAPGASGYDNATSSPKYRDQIAKIRADSDAKRLEETRGIEQQAYENAATADRATELIAADTPTGAFSEQRIGLGKTLGKVPLLGRLPGIPNAEQTDNLQTMRILGNQAALGDVGKLKGPLSDKDIAFIKSMQYSADATKGSNARVRDVQKWVASRQAAYSSSLRTWTDKLGSPSALNGKGESFDRWWGGYSANALAPPGLGPRSRPGPAKPTGAKAMSDAEIKAALGL